MKNILHMIKILSFLFVFVLLFFPTQANAQPAPGTDLVNGGGFGLDVVNGETVERARWDCNGGTFSGTSDEFDFFYLPPYCAPKEGDNMGFRAFYELLPEGGLSGVGSFLEVYRVSDGVWVYGGSGTINFGVGSSQVRFTIYTWTAQPGDYCIHSFIDPNNDMAESDETNNEETRCFTVTSAPTPSPSPSPSPSPQPPTLQSLTVTNAGNTGFAGVSGVTGRQSGADSGSDWFNPISITVNAAQGSALIKEYYVKFTPGFEVAYQTSIDSISGCTSSNHCYYSGGWNSLPTAGVTSGGVTVKPNGANSWQAIYAPSFGSNNNISTSAYVKDTNNLCSGGNCTYAVLSGKTCNGNICTIP